MGQPLWHRTDEEMAPDPRPHNQSRFPCFTPVRSQQVPAPLCGQRWQLGIKKPPNKFLFVDKELGGGGSTRRNIRSHTPTYTPLRCLSPEHVSLTRSRPVHSVCTVPEKDLPGEPLCPPITPGVRPLAHLLPHCVVFISIPNRSAAGGGGVFKINSVQTSAPLTPSECDGRRTGSHCTWGRALGTQCAPPSLQPAEHFSAPPPRLLRTLQRRHAPRPRTC